PEVLDVAVEAAVDRSPGCPGACCGRARTAHLGARSAHLVLVGVDMSTTAVMPRRLTALIFAVCTAGGAVLVVAAWEFATSTESGTRLLGLGALTAAATLAERFPVPISPEGGGVLSLTFVFAVAAIVLYGWAVGALLLLAATAAVHLVQHRPLVRIGYNVSVLAIVALAAGTLISPIHGNGV